MAKYTDCVDGHTSTRISGKDDNEFVINVEAHLKATHPKMAIPPREKILAMSKQG
jgi:hypothetical protein